MVEIKEIPQTPFIKPKRTSHQVTGSTQQQHDPQQRHKRNRQQQPPDEAHQIDEYA